MNAARLARYLRIAILSLFSQLTLAAQPLAQLIVIIDDLGNNKALSQAAVDLPVPVSLSFLPHTPHAKSLALQAHQLGHDVMLHVPMDNRTGAKLGPGALTREMTGRQIQHILLASMNAVPHVNGINNHMGSLLTLCPDAMQAVMTVLKRHGLFFVDSLTTPESIAGSTASAVGIPSLQRDVFLDNSTVAADMQLQFERAIKLAQTRGYAVLIAHPYPASMQYLKEQLPKLHQHNVVFTSAQKFLQKRIWPSVELNSRFPL